LGTAVFGGLVAATALVVFFAPVLYSMMQHSTEWRSHTRDTDLASDLLAKENSF
jgi:hypothetical protein